MFYLARMTHNYNNNWEKPSGPKYKSPNKDSAFEAKYKFGFEEWFRCQRHQLDGYQYAYLESLEAHHCNSKILLHTIRHNDGNQKSNRTLVGVLHKSYYYTDWNDVSLQEISDLFYEGMKKDLTEALAALTKEEQQSAINQLNSHKNFIGGKPLFNVRYKKEYFDYIFPKHIDSVAFTKNRRFGIQEIKSPDFQAYPESVQQHLLALKIG